MIHFFRQSYRSILIVLGLFVILWIIFSPVQIGGSVAYVIISGNSMEPEFSEGDLVLSRETQSYYVGDRVVYKHPKVGYVFHRIVDQSAEGFVLKGDNNDWLDSFHPLLEDMVGKFWFSISMGGFVIRTLREPIYFSGFSLIILIVIVSLFWFQKNEPKRKLSKRIGKNMDKHKMISAGDTRQEILLFIVLLTVVTIIFGIISYTKPLTKVIPDDISYTHHGSFEYTADGTENIYDSDTIKTGEPVYLLLTCDVEMSFQYQFLSERMLKAEKDALKGTYQVTALLSDIDGWKREFQLIPETEFQGLDFETEMHIDICKAQSLIIEKEEKTETKNRWYSLMILPDINLTGGIENKLLVDTYQPVIEFQMDTNMLRLPEGVEGLVLDQEGSIENRRVVNNTMVIFGQEINITLARRIALISLGLSLAAAVLPSWSLYRDWKESDISRIQVQYHPLLIDIQEGAPALQAGQVVDVASFSDLIKMAERYGAMILHETKGNFHRYSVQDEQTVYRYDIGIFMEQSLFSNISRFRRSLLNAIRENQLELYYQPVINLKDNSIVGLEAFIRWNHPEFGTLYPADFISHAEDCGLLPEVDVWVTQNVCAQITDWVDQKLKVVPVSINISPDTILSDRFINDIARIIGDESCQSKFLQVEINRSNQVFREESIQDHLAQLTDLGISLAIDNFATDSANQIDQVFQMPIRTIKIDRKVISGISDDENNMKLIRAVVAMAQSLQVEVVAQGVESQKHVDILKDLGIDKAQGFFLGNPIQAVELTSILKKPRTRKIKKTKSDKRYEKTN